MKYSTPENFKREEQLDLFFETDPAAKKRFEKVNFRISILGGNASENQSRELGGLLAKNWYSVSTGGYNFGTMRGALEGASEAVKNLKNDPNEGRFTSLFNPAITGIVAQNVSFSMAKGEHISTDITEGKYDIYIRLGKLIEDSDVCIILPGDTGTEVEVMANLHFNQKVKMLMKLPTKPIIFIGNQYDEMLKTKFGGILVSPDSNVL